MSKQNVEMGKLIEVARAGYIKPSPIDLFAIHAQFRA